MGKKYVDVGSATILVDHNGTTLRLDTDESTYGGCCIAISLAGKKARMFFPTPAQRKAIRKALAQREDR